MIDRLLDLCSQASEQLSITPLRGPVLDRLKKDAPLKKLVREIERGLQTHGEVHRPRSSRKRPKDGGPLTAVAWNIERGKRFDAILATLTKHPDLQKADLYFLTEVDWGMARSGNRNVAAELARELNFHAYFAPSYFNFTNGHGNERGLDGRNALGLHGKAILSRYPIEDLRVIAMPNATDKLTSKEARLGQKRALLGRLRLGWKSLDVACVHLDAFSSPRMRAHQMKLAAGPLSLSRNNPALVAGDWNTNTLDSSSGRSMFLSILAQLLFMGPRAMIRNHHPHPEYKFDRSLFRALSELGFDYEAMNEMGVGTFDVVSDDLDLGQMAMDQFPIWILKWINRLVEKCGGSVSLKLDWFAGKKLKPLDKKVLRLGRDLDRSGQVRPSDHHPILLKFTV